MEASGDLPYWESDRANIVRWLDGDGVWHEGPIRDEMEALQAEHYILHIETEDGDRFFTVHYPPTEDFDLDYEVDRIETEYGGEAA